MNAIAVNINDFFDKPHNTTQQGNNRPSRAQKREAKKLLKQAKKVEAYGKGKFEPRSAAQAELVEALDECEQLFVIGPAGTGKSYVTARYAARKVAEGVYDHIVITRPFVGIGGTKSGFLPGNLKQKVAPWAVPIMVAIEDEVGKAQCEKWQNEGVIVIESFEFMRGRTYNNSFIILDEAQNTTVEQMKAFLTRTGENSQVVVDGDLTQLDDLRRESGLKYAIDLIEKYDMSPEIFEFYAEDVVRAGVVKEWVIVFEKDAEGRN